MRKWHCDSLGADKKKEKDACGNIIKSDTPAGNDIILGTIR